MTDEADNVVLRLLRDIRGDTLDLRGRMTRVERRLDDLHESLVTALGMAAHANVVTERAGASFDEIRDEIEALKRRVADLEAAPR